MLQINVAISAESFCGEDLAVDPAFSSLRADVDRPGGFDAQKVEAAAGRLLSERSRDIRLLAYLALAFVMQGKWTALIELFEEFSALLRDHFSELYPRRPRARTQALQWFDEDRLMLVLESSDTRSISPESLSALCSSLDSLREAAALHCPDTPSLFKGLHTFFSTRSPSPAPSPAPAVAPLSSQASALPSSAAIVAAAPAELPSSRSERLDLIRSVAAALLAADPADLLAQRLLRLVRWDGVKAPPVENGLSRIVAPAAERAAHLASLCSREDWKALLCETTRLFAAGPTIFWLDLQRYAFCAAAGMGEAELAAAIAEATADFCRLPGLETAAFSDGTAFADRETRVWLQEILSNRPVPISAAEPKISDYSLQSGEYRGEAGRGPPLQRIVLEILVPGQHSTLQAAAR